MRHMKNRFLNVGGANSDSFYTVLTAQIQVSKLRVQKGLI
jgi:hypothetical protein